MNALSKSRIFCRVMEKGSFTGVAEEIGYSQSAVSQIIRGLEKELGTQLIERRREGIRLTPDGVQYFPYLQAICGAEEALERKRREMQGLENSMIRILTFTSVSRNILPPMMKKFRQEYPGVDFQLKQGDYTSIRRDIVNGEADFGFMSTGDASYTDVRTHVLYEDGMVAVLPAEHPLTARKSVSLTELAKEPFILLNEGEDYNTVETGFARYGLKPRIEYDVYDDYTILAMIRQGFGVSILFRKVIQGFEKNVEIREIDEPLSRTVALVWRDWNTMPLASRRFADFIIRHIQDYNG